MKSCNGMNNSGFTLIETLIALMVLLIAAIGAVGMHAKFGIFTGDIKNHEYVYNAADSAISQCRAGVSPITSPADVTVTVSTTLSNSTPSCVASDCATCAPTAGCCCDVIVTATRGANTIVIPSPTSAKITLCNN
jgi:prepilin-type N-terminal cleavage/methylation domain-containing protein